MPRNIIQTFITIFITMITTANFVNASNDNLYQDGITLSITNKAFNPQSHKIGYCGKTPCIIDGKFFYGGNGIMPKTEVAGLEFKQEGRTIKLDTTSMYDSGITNKNIKEHITVERYFGKRSYRIIGYFGGDKSKRIEPYIVHWLVLPGGSVRNHIGDYESLTGLVYKVNEDFNIQQ